MVAVSVYLRALIASCWPTAHKTGREGFKQNSTGERNRFQCFRAHGLSMNSISAHIGSFFVSTLYNT